MGTMPYDSRSVWNGSQKPHFLPLYSNLETHTCIIGAGIAGLSAAYNLLLSGVPVVVLERETLGCGETGLSSAHLATSFDRGFKKLLSVHDPEMIRRAYESHQKAIDFIEETCRGEEIDCDFKRLDGFLCRGEKTTATEIREEFESIISLGINDVEFIPEFPYQELESGPCIRYTRQAQFNPVKYISGLAQAIRLLGGKIYTHTEVNKINSGDRPQVTTALGFKVTCEKLIIATNSPVQNNLGVYTKMGAYRTYVIGLRLPMNPSTSQKVAQANQNGDQNIRQKDFLVWDTSEPYHYIRFAFDEGRNESLLLLGGEDHRTGQGSNPEEHFKDLYEWGKKHIFPNYFPNSSHHHFAYQNIATQNIATQNIATKWSGQILEPVDGLAFIGENPGEENVYIATGFSGQGTTYGTIAGILLKDLILKRKNPWEEVYDPSRFTVSPLGQFLHEMAASTVPYTDWLSAGDVQDIDEIAAGEGAIYRDGIEKLAIYKDTTGELKVFSATCPHMGGLVRWNTAEKSWDCPCHGSRFDRHGQVINGPALQGLKAKKDNLIRVPQEVENQKLPPTQPLLDANT